MSGTGKGILQWLDGTETKTQWGGGVRVYVPNTDLMIETTFEATGTRGDAIVYREVSRRDIRKDMAEASERIEQRTWETLERGWQSINCINNDCRCSCHRASANEGGEPK